MVAKCEVPDNCPQAQQAADAAVRRVFAILGIDVDVPKEVSAFQEDLRFGRSMRRAADRGMLAIVGLVAVALAGAVWAGIVSNIKGH